MNPERRKLLKGIGAAITLAAFSPAITVKAAVDGFSGKKESESDKLTCPIHYIHEVPDMERFEGYIAGLMDAKKNYFPVAMRDVADYLYDGIQVWPEDKKPIVITFDDALLSQYENALPILEKWALRATFFVLTDYADGVHNYMEPQHFREISDGGREVAAHGMDMHKSLPLLFNEDPEAWRRNIAGVKYRLEDIIGREVTSFAYPNGSFDQRTMDLVSETGYKIAVRTGGEYPTVSSSSIFKGPRVSINF